MSRSLPKLHIRLVLGLTASLAVFAIDVLYPIGAVAGAIYVVIAVCAFFISARDAIILASAATAANVIAYCLAPSASGPEWIVGVNRGASVLTTWLLIVTGIHFHQESQAVIAAIRESNERRRLALEAAERAHRDRLNELQLITDAIPMLIAYVDLLQRFQFVNASYETAYGMPLEQILGKTVSEIMGDEAYRRLEGHFDAALRGTRVQFEQPVLREDRTHWWLFQLLPRINEEHCVVGIYTLVTDITGLKRSQEEVDMQREALAVFSRRGAANEMAAALAHEINQPLSTIAIYSGRLVELLGQGKADQDDLLRAMELMYEEAIRAGQIIKRARAIVDDRPIQPTLISADMLVDSVRKICSTRAAIANVSLKTELESTDQEIYADLVQMQQVLVNLVVNAIEAAQDCPIPRRGILLVGSFSADGAQFQVVDSGIGLEGDGLRRLFEPHYTTKKDGLGIGLSIARSIVVAHGGRIWATANATLGTTFHVSLPSAPTEPPPIATFENLPLLSKST